MNGRNKFTYIDLFCGIGGFHQAISNVFSENSKCIFAADIDDKVASVYKNTYGIEANYDLTQKSTFKLIDKRVTENGNHLNMICAGFPCQAFSKAGKRQGFLDSTKGTLFFQVARLAKMYKPEYILLENVRNLKGHDNKKTWKVIKETLEDIGYIVDDVLISPNSLGIPALRERIIIMCYRSDLNIRSERLYNGARILPKNTSIYARDGKLKTAYFFRGSEQDIEDDKYDALVMWEDLNKRLRRKRKRLYSPIWTEYFFGYKGDLSKFPEWKQILIKKNMEFYKENKSIIDIWIKENSETWNRLSKTYKKFEWNAGDDITSIWEGIIQFRPSGIRVKRPDFMPTFVAINQTPIIGCEKRYIKPQEMAKLYGFKGVRFDKSNTSQTYKQLGNTVCVDVIEKLFKDMIITTNMRGGNYKCQEK